MSLSLFALAQRQHEPGGVWWNPRVSFVWGDIRGGSGA